MRTSALALAWSSNVSTGAPGSEYGMHSVPGCTASIHFTASANWPLAELTITGWPSASFSLRRRPD